MSGLLELILSNALAAGALAALAWVASRRLRRPALVHGLWVLALVKLVTPPLVPLPLVPDWSEARLGAPQGPALVIVQTEDASGDVEAPALDRGAPFSVAGPPVSRVEIAAPALETDAGGVAWTPPETADPGMVASIVLALGALVVSGTAGWRIHRFRALLRHARVAPVELQGRASALARTIGLDRVPPVRLLDARVPPMLWPSGRGPVLLLPEGLLPGLSEEERDTLLVHELAHVRRRDHWVRGLELVVTALFWWYPVAWWARRALRQAEERCCDEWVVRALPGSARAYAEGLLKSLDFVAAEPDPLPTGASGAGPVRDLEARLKEIVMTTRPLPRLNTATRLALALLATLCLAVFPTRAQTPEDSPGEPPDAAATPVGPAPVVAPSPVAPISEAPSAVAPPPVSPAPEVAPGVGPEVTPVLPAPPAPAAPSPRVLAAPRPTPGPVPVPSPPVEAAPAPGPAPDPVLVHGPSPEDEEVLRDVEARRRTLEARRVELHRQELEMARRRMETRSRQEQEHLAAEIERMRDEGDQERAALLERHAQVIARRAEVQRQELELQQARLADQASREKAIQEALEQRIVMEKEGREEEAAALRQRLSEIERERLLADVRLEEQQMTIQQEVFEIERQAQEVEMELALAMQDRDEKRMKALMKDQALQAAAERSLEEKEMAARRVAQALRATELEIQQREAAGEQAAAEALRADAQRMRTEMDAMRQELDTRRRNLHEKDLLQASSHLEEQIEGQLQALRGVQAEGAVDGPEVTREIARLEAALKALRQAGE